jgi:transposase
MQDCLDLDVDANEAIEALSWIPRKAHVRNGRVFREKAVEEYLPVDLRMLIPPGDASLWIREGLVRLDLSFLDESYPDCGGVAYDPRAMLGILLLGYHEGIAGSRTLEKRCLRDVGYMHVSYGQKPDDRTIRRFRRRLGPLLDTLFRLVVQACKEAGLLGMRRVAIDGTKLTSRASRLKRWLSASEKEDVAEMGFEPPECSDKDARNLGASGKFTRGYNCQTAVDCDSGVTAAVAVDNVSSDGHWLAPMVKKIVENVGEAPAQIVADAGYDTNEGACACANLGIEAIIAPQSPVSAFWSVTQDDEIVCPMGSPALPSGVRQLRGSPYQVLKVSGCATCPLFQECCGVSGSRSLALPEGCDPIERLNAAYRARSPQGREAMRERMAKIEPVFADIKWNKGLKRFVLSGEDGARIEWTLIHIARNLKKLMEALRALLHAVLALSRSRPSAALTAISTMASTLRNLSPVLATR